MAKPNTMRQAREAVGIPRSLVAVHVNRSADSVARWERGQRIPDRGTLIVLSRMYGVPLDQLTGENQ